MGRVSKPTTRTLVSSSWVSDFIDDYVSQTDPSDQNITSNLNFASGKAPQNITLMCLGKLRSGIGNGGVILTFDDGTEGHYDELYPLMQSYGWAGVLYLPVDWLGVGGAAITASEIRTMVSDGWEMGSHTTDHGYRGAQGGQSSSTEVDYQWRHSRREIERLYYTFPVSAAYPGGTRNAMIKAIASRYYSVICRFGYAPASPYWNVTAEVELERWGVADSNYNDGRIATGLTNAAANDNYVVYAFHKVVASSPGADDITTAHMTWVLDQIQASGLECYTFKSLAATYGLTYPICSDVVSAGMDLWALRVSTLPTPGAEYRGNIIFRDQGAGVADLAYICLKAADDSYSWILFGTG